MLDSATIERLESMRDEIIVNGQAHKAALRTARHEVDLDDVDILDVATIYFREVSR